jgi:hypothetical protein
MVRVDQRTMLGKFNITKLGPRDDIILGFPWLAAVEPQIDWANKILTLNPTERSREFDKKLPAELNPYSRKPDSIPDHYDYRDDLWCDLSTPIETPQKFSNKAQEFAIEEAQKAAKKSFEELVPSYLHSFTYVFGDEGFKELPPSRPGIDHRIDTKPGFEPRRAKAYALSPSESKAVREFLDEHLAKGSIVPSISPQASGFFFVAKKDGSSRPCQDYRYINEWTVKNAYPLPLIPPLMNKLRDAKVFTKMDVRWGYNNIPIHPEDRWKAAFITEYGLFEPTVMFFGLCNSPATFQAFMNRIFEKEIAEGWMIVYMDDILHQENMTLLL